LRCFPIKDRVMVYLRNQLANFAFWHNLSYIMRIKGQE